MIEKRPLAKLRHWAAKNPTGRAAYILAHVKTEGDVVLVDEALQEEIKKRFPSEVREPPRIGPRGRFKLADLQSKANRWPAGFADFVLERGKVEGDSVVLDATAAGELHQKFPPTPPPPAPTLAELAGNFTGAMAGWAQAGFKVVERGEYERRHAICLSCEYWQPDAMLGMGKCRKCGCSKFKLWLATSKCPDKPPRW